MYRALTDRFETATEACFCGYIKAKFPLDDDRYVNEQPHRKATSMGGHVRRTENFVYLTLGHLDLPSNQRAREYLKAIDGAGGKVTRLDFAIDLLESFPIEDYYQGRLAAWNEAKSTVGTPQPSLITSPAGNTVYVGKRSSSRMLRIYDKRAEIKAKTRVDIEMDLTRIELEVKRDAVPTYKRLFQAGNTLAIARDIVARYGLPERLIDSPSKVKPTSVDNATNGAIAFVDRFKKVIRRAYLESPEMFCDIIGIDRSIE